MQQSFLRYYLQAFIRPGIAFNQLLADKRRVRFGFFFVCIPALLYTLMYIFLTLGGGAPSSFTPWLNIPKEVYYSWNQFLAAPSFFLCWIVAAGAGQLLSRFFSGKGSFEDMTAVLGLSIGVAMWATLPHDLTMSFLSAIHVIDAAEHEIAMNSPTIWRTLIWTFMILYMIWFLLLFSKAARAAQKVGSGPAVLLGFLCFAAFQIIFFIFNR